MKVALSGKYFRLILGSYALTAVLFFLYTYTQVDLGLTLTDASIWQSIQKWFQEIGYFNRPLSSGIYVSLIFLLSLLSFTTAFLAYRKKLSVRELNLVIVAAAVPLVFSYPAFSYDFFNYMFTAKTVLVYGQNPYLVKPLDFAGIEPWLSFLRWTHLTSAYTPVWIALTLFPFLLGFGYFIGIMWSLKILIAGSYFLAVYLVYRILTLLKDDLAVYGTAVFALNPLVLVEAVASPHNDMLMVAAALGAMYLFLLKKPWLSLLTWALSVSLKLMTIFLAPLYFKKWNRGYALALMFLALVAGFLKKELLPWYALWIAPFVAINTRLTKVHLIFWGLSLGLVFSYTPYLYYGDYGEASQMAKNIIFWTFTGGSLLVSGIWYNFKNNYLVNFKLKIRSLLAEKNI